MSVIELVAPLAGWAMPLTEVPDPVFAEGMMGDGLAIEPLDDIVCAPCAGTVTTIHAARHAVTLQADGDVALLIHIGIDSVTMAGEGFTALVEAGDRVAAGDPLIRFDLDRLVMSARAAVVPLIVTDAEAVIVDRHAGGLVAAGDVLLRVTPAMGAATAATEAPSDAMERQTAVGLPHGLHARPAARIAAALRPLAVEVTLVAGDRSAPAASTIAMLGLGLAHGTPVTIRATGADAEEAIARVADLLAREEQEAPAPAPAPPPPPPADTPAGALAGVAAAPGLAIGPAHWLRRARPVPPETGAGVEAERANLARGMAAIRAALDAAADAPGQAAGVFGAHREILSDPALEQAAAAAIDAGDGAAAAILAVTTAQAKTLRASGDARIAERADDILDVGERVAHAILGTRAGTGTPPAGAVLLAEDLLPSQFAALDPARVAGIALVRGGPTAHVAILAAGAGVPMVVALGNQLLAVMDGAPLLLDGDAGHALPDPDADTRARAEATIARRTAAEAQARTIGPAAVTTRDGIAVAVQANCGSAADAHAAMDAGADGCGLLRTEFLFLGRAAAPDRAEQAACYAAVLAALPDRPVTIRLLDIGGDKPAPYLALPAEENPALGLRGVRVALSHGDVLETQLAAILSLPDLSRVKIMVPMVASLHEMAAVRDALDRLRGDRGVALGAMIETPAAAIGADLIARDADFLSIGSNDLTQYALAADRGNPAVAAMLDGMHPAVLRLIAETCTRAGDTPVSVCGGLAADPLAAPILIGLGVRALSVPPARIAATKALVAGQSLAALRDHARAALACASPSEVRALARHHAGEMGR